MHQIRDKVVATGLADEIAFRLQAAILDGEFPPGTHLQQDELCARFGVSRTPVREALRKLQAQHLVDLVPNKGATVRTPSRDELSEIYVLRAELEGLAAELAADRIDPAALAALDEAQKAMDEAVAQLEAHAVTADEEASFNRRITLANEDFHGIIHEACGNQRLRQYLIELQNLFPKDYLWRAISSDLSRWVGIEEHRAIRVALKAHDRVAARRTMSDHVAHSGRLLLAYLDEHSFWQ